MGVSWVALVADGDVAVVLFAVAGTMNGVGEVLCGL